MKPLICPTCGCSLVRLGISKDKATRHNYKNQDYYFCCQACVDVFVADPQTRFLETSDLIVCPTCLAEKPKGMAVQLTISGEDVYFCRCPHCHEVFQKAPDYYRKRLADTDVDQ